MLTRKQHELLLLIHRRLQAEGIPPSFDEMKDELDLKSKSGIHRLITALEERGFIKRLPNRARALEVIRLPEGYEAKNDMAGVSREKISGFQPELVHGGLASNSLSKPQSGKLPLLDAENSDAANSDNAARGNVMPFERKGGLASRFRSSDSGVGEGGVQDASPRGFSESGQSKGLLGGQEGLESGVAVPVMGKIAAGVPISAIQHITHSVSVPPSMLGLGNHFALQVQGDSMIGAGILDGDMVIIRETSAAEAGDIIVALVDDEEATLKRFSKSSGKVYLEAANPAYETRVLAADRVKVQGRLAGLVRKY